MKNYRKANQEKGITLVALIITIIILIILAAVAIRVVYDSQLVKYATNGTGNYIAAGEEENRIFNGTISYVDSVVEGLGESGYELEYSPQGNIEYAKEHTIKVVLKENVKSVKYQWVKQGEEPIENNYIEIINNEETITKNDISGIWYVCFLIEKQNGKQTIEKTQEFYFDNNAPTVELTTTPISENSFTLIAKAKDSETQMLQYQFFVDNQLVQTINKEDEMVTFLVEGTATGEKNCYVVVKDTANNTTNATVNARTLLHTWEKWNIKRVYTLSASQSKTGEYYFSKNYDIYKLDSSSGGKWILNLVNANVSWQNLNKYIGCYTLSDNKMEILHMVLLTNTNASNKCINVNVYSSSTFKTEESKGTKIEEYLNATKNTTYPQDGISGSYYYIYTGLK